MHSRATRDRLVFPVAAVVALGLVSAPHSTVSVPRIAEVSAIRLQAEVTAFVSGLDDTAVTALASAAPGAAASSLTGPAPTAAATTCPYPCTVFDKFLWNLPAELLPPLYAIAWVIGLVMAPVVLVTPAIFGWPVSLRPAAATAPETVPSAAAATAATGELADAGTSPSVPGATLGAGDTAVVTAAATDDPAPRGRAARSIRAESIPADSPESPAPAAESPAPVVAAPESVVAAPESVVAAPESVSSPAPTADVLTPEMTAPEEAAAAGPRSNRPHGRAAQAGPSDSSAAPRAAATRSVR